MLRSVLTGLATTAVLSQNARAQFVVTEDTYFDGQSPPVYPSRMYFSSNVHSLGGN